MNPNRGLRARPKCRHRFSTNRFHAGSSAHSSAARRGGSPSATAYWAQGGQGRVWDVAAYSALSRYLNFLFWALFDCSARASVTWSGRRMTVKYSTLGVGLTRSTRRFQKGNCSDNRTRKEVL